MSKFKELVKSPTIQIALVTGFSIIFMAYFSKRVLPRPIGYLALAIPPFLATIHSAVSSRYGDQKICTTGYWVVGILVATTLVILLHAI